METRAHKIRLVPTLKQEIQLRKTVGTARFAYNWALAEWNKAYEAYKADKTKPKPSAYDLSKLWTKTKPEWADEVSRGPITKAILNVGQAFINMWNGHGKHPVFHKRGRKDSFYVDNTKAKIKGRKVHLPRIGPVKLREELRFEGKIVSYTVSHKAGQWHVSVQVEVKPEKTNNKSKAGVDVGINKLAVASDGTICENPKHLAKEQQKLKKLQRRLARQTKGSNRRERTKRRIGRAYINISNKRNDAMHKFTTMVTKSHGTVVVEDLDVKGMNGSRWLNRLLQDTAMRGLLRQLEYKAGTIIKAPRYFPSSKRCSVCGNVKEEYPCSHRVYNCKSCGLEGLDRDLNAAINLKNTPWVTG